MTTRYIRNLGQVEALAAFVGKHIPCTVTVVEGVKRSSPQNNISHTWYSEIAAQLGDRTATEVRAESKLHLGIPILREDDEAYRITYDNHLRPLPYETKLALMAPPMELPVTSLMNKGQMMRYLDEMQRYWGGHGVHLSDQTAPK